jgi:hypothetical protein
LQKRRWIQACSPHAQQLQRRHMATDLATFIDHASEQLTDCLGLFEAYGVGDGIAGLEHLVDLCENHPLYVREWPQLETLTAIIDICAAAGELPPDINNQALKLSCRLEALKVSIN